MHQDSNLCWCNYIKWILHLYLGFMQVKYQLQIFQMTSFVRLWCFIDDYKMSGGSNFLTTMIYNDCTVWHIIFGFFPVYRIKWWDGKTVRGILTWRKILVSLIDDMFWFYFPATSRILEFKFVLKELPRRLSNCRAFKF